MEYLLGLGCNKLASIRLESPNAGGLVVAASVQHAKTIQKILVTQFHQSAAIVTYRHDEPLSEINAYRHGNTEWIVSVGMISEGTDIPRLQVCCHISSEKTELYFRQVLGRILRVNNEQNQKVWLFTFVLLNILNVLNKISPRPVYLQEWARMKLSISMVRTFADCKLAPIGSLMSYD
jgi:superfamily II DNA or RNA helicase